MCVNVMSSRTPDFHSPTQKMKITLGLVVWFGRMAARNRKINLSRLITIIIIQVTFNACLWICSGCSVWTLGVDM